MGEANNKILARMLERLFAGLVNGPNLNCRPHSSRQRIDFTQLVKLCDLTPDEALRLLLDKKAEVKLTGRVPTPKRPKGAGGSGSRANNPTASETRGAEEPQLTPEEKAAQTAWNEQFKLLAKIRILADEARTYEQDTGEHALNIGLPLLSLPPGSLGASGRRTAAKRVLAPLAFIPVALTLRSGPTPTIEIACREGGVDRVTPNPALLSWLEQQTGKPLGELFADERGEDPWREISELTRQVCKELNLDVPEAFKEPVAHVPAAPPAVSEPASAGIPAPSLPSPAPSEPNATPSASVKEQANGAGEQRPTGQDTFALQPAPRADDGDARPAIVSAAVLGLFPLNNQGLLRDTQAMLAGEAVQGPIESFIQANVSLDQLPDASYDHEAWSGQRRPRDFASERYVIQSDPCQSRAVRLARACRGLVVHGPPGTGKSQTITNIIGDHLARGERVLMVCDKRTALDVVANRLEHLGLGSLCALVHDARHDQHNLYRAIREQIENLTDTHGDPRAEGKLKKVDAELQKLHAELTQCWTLLMEKDGKVECTFHELMGQWLSAPAPQAVKLDTTLLSGAKPQDLELHEQTLHGILARGKNIGYAQHPWREAAGVSLEEFLARPTQEWRAALARCAEAARSADATLDATIPPFAAEPGVAVQGQARGALAIDLAKVLEQPAAGSLEAWAKKDSAALQRTQQKLAKAGPALEILRSGPLEAELGLVVQEKKLASAALAQQLGAIEAYLAVAAKWYGLLCFKRRSQALAVLAWYGLPPSVNAAERMRTFLVGLRARLVLQALCKELLGRPLANDEASADEWIDQTISAHARLVDLLLRVKTDPGLAGLTELVTQSLLKPKTATNLIAGLQKSAARATALTGLEETLVGSHLFDRGWLSSAFGQWRAGQKTEKALAGLNERIGDLEDMLRIRAGLAEVPKEFQGPAKALLDASTPADAGVAALRKAVLAAQISERLRGNATLQTLDGQRILASFERCRALEDNKREFVRDSVLHHWTSKQQERLLVGTGTRLNSLGADLRRRLTMRGERALRLRQVVAFGQAIEGGDPLFDLRPVWMASPQTVSQVFPRQPLFDVAIFDEASQCRLEEALPVLLRAKRVVIAGDPKQLPPTRFFESGVAASEDEDVETDQQLFEAHQGELEDLLSAALGIDIQQCYLDVHYRSRNADLIEFSNHQFYSSRLQPIPGHPAHRARFAPVTLYRANGIYEERTNPLEAEQVCRIVGDLLKRAEPPSIGVACFNLAQRDLIVEKLEELAQEDAEFAARLGDARVRQGASTFEGLFVKNLENVQGDERDHIIISTTYGPDATGRFYRRFGPLGRAGGGRRLNVLVTRAREEVHLVTSIPPAVYRNLPAVPANEAPSGGWLLFAYLAYAEQLAKAYEAAHEAQAKEGKAEQVSVKILPSRSPSEFATALARQLANEQKVGSDVHWGNDGFCIDLALHHPQHADEVTIGVLCDGVRFAQAEDPVEWDLFRTWILESQGWQLHRVWTPHFFRDPRGAVEKILKDAAQAIASEEAKDAIRVVGQPKKGR
ncbi:MAG TPA: AAA domain-containing protein [Gemmataceae bacterium]|nr:AAA domain-containing protein [Gemmataceae bacterium]